MPLETSLNPDPPSNFSSAVDRFRKFIVTRGYPSVIRWVVTDDVIPGKGPRYWVREYVGRKRGIQAGNEYGIGLAKNSGIALNAIGKNANETFAVIFVPADDIDAQYHLMGRCLKITCATEHIPVSVVRNPVLWFVLELLNRKRIKGWRETGEL